MTCARGWFGALLFGALCLVDTVSATTLTVTITDELLPQRTASTQKVTLEGLTDCSTNGVTSLEVIYEGDIITYSYVAEESASLWAGTETVDLLGHARIKTMKVSPAARESSSGYYSLTDLEATAEESTSLPCMVNAHISSSAGSVSFVVGTFADGTVWADVIDTVQESTVTEVEIEYGESPPPEDFTELDDGSIIDMVVPYTSEALCSEAGLAFPCDFSQAGSVLSKIDFLIAETNTILAASGIALRVQGRGSWRTEDYTEGELSFSDTLIRMQTPNDGRFENPNLLALRNAGCADVVGLVTRDGESVPGGTSFGQAVGIGPSTAVFSFVSSLDSDAISGFTFTHELGHVLVCFCML